MSTYVIDGETDCFFIIVNVMLKQLMAVDTYGGGVFLISRECFSYFSPLFFFF